ncbi:uncharacterized protein TRIADDRAFT_31364 [Trichoplax adhaerens]|uniref:Laminin G domain-containing protein n=1 Tax=Trichoplax adhaerens TaxID=10228 RepID=B3S945_TRIAD|nr:hypothetical protein TRIADDRAFT_31364 [Trichoplax adhaerens]EDV20734.1 hypothetical protein TRIADDRAFT_31364 [Trichoplax adhaerens]|eukprot:XP_002116675.1 hypothetical protein TRIADDRAFT_31364 [Trichoplax adhaerens]
MATKPFKVHCRDDDITTTEIAHNQSHNYIKVPSDTSLVGPGKFEVNYTYGYGATFDQLGTLAEQSQNCSQFIGYECQRSVLLNWPKMPYVWWTSRSGTSVFSWGGAPANSSMCDCGLTDTCHGGTGTRCNCDSNSHASLKDEGVIHDRNLLPVKKIHIGYERFTSLTLSFYKLGPFRCGGQGRWNTINDVVNLGNQTHIALSDWKDKLDLDISLKFKTVLPEAILMYNDGALSNFFTLSYTPHKILLRYNLNQGNNTVSILQTENYHEGFDDNEWHSVRFRLLYNSAELQVDNLKKVSAEYPIERPLSVFDSQGPIFLGKDPHG